ncbi:MAG TPA: hypothetical protein DER12_04330 [Lachnospiraceae bacterium]|nr:hypothetical protein [Lachnospiraceae bacterium]
MGAKDLAEKNLLQYKDVFSDIVNVNLFGGRCYVSAEELSREPSELITKAVSDDKLRQLQMDVPMKCKKNNRSFFLCLENQSDKNNVMPVRDMGYQHAKYMEQIKEAKESNRETGNYPNPMTKELNDSQKLSPVITLVLNYSQKEWETTIRQYQSDFKYIVRYLSCGNDRRKLDEYFQTTEFQLDHPEAFLDWLSAVTNDRRYRKAKELIQKTERKGGKINMCVLLDMYEERGEARGEARGIEKGIAQGIVQGEARGVAKGISQGIEEINTLYHCLLADNRMEDIQKAIMDTDYQKELLQEYGIGE